MKNNLIKLAGALLALAVTAVLLTVGASAAAITETVNMMQVNQNTPGDGYYWHNPTDTMTLTNVNIDTASEFGLKMPDGSKLVLEGKNYIKAASAALFCEGKLTISGSGSLTLVSDGVGILVNTTNEDYSMRVISGSIEIRSGGIGVKSDYATVSFADCSADIESGGEAVAARILLIGGCKSFKANNTLKAGYKLSISASALDVSAPGKALDVPANFTMNEVSLKTGATGALADAESYNGEQAIKTVSTASTITPSVLFGPNVSIAADIIVIIVFLAIVAAVVAVPIVRYRRRVAAIKAANKAAKSAARHS